MSTFKEYPGVKTYRAANGHTYEVSPNFSQYNQEWFYIYANGGHSDECTCSTWDVDDWGDLD